MIEKGSIQLRDVVPGETNGKVWKRITLTINGKKFSSFNEPDARFNVGDYVEVDYEQKGKYSNIKSIRVTDGPSQEQTQIVSSNGVDRDKRMARMNALTNANALLATLAETNPEVAKEMLSKDNLIAVLISTAAALTEFICEEGN